MRTNSKKRIFVCLFLFVFIAIVFIAVFYANREALANDNKSSGKKLNPPVIKVEQEQPDGSLLNAVKGTRYRIPKAEAYDCFEEKIEVETNVYLFYSSQTKSVINVSEGCFIPEYYGEYTIEYKATDRAKNTSVKTLNVSCEIKEPLTANLEINSTAATVGDYIALAGYNYANNIGNVECSVVATHTATGKTFKVEELIFLPEYVGEYEMRYIFRDYNEIFEKSYIINAAEDRRTKLYGDYHLLKYYIVGCAYQLDLPQLVNYETGSPITVLPDVYVKYNAKIFERIDYKTFIPKEPGIVTIKFVAKVGQDVFEKEYQAQSIDVDYQNGVDMSKCFYSENAGFKSTDYGVEMSSSSGSCSAEFINSVISEELFFDFGISKSNNDFNSVDIVLTDSEDESIKVKITLKKTDAKSSLLYINNDNPVKTSANFYDGKTISVKYTENGNEISFDKVTGLKIKKTINGEKFNGFKSGKAYISLGMNGIEKKSKLLIYRLNYQVFNNTTDSLAPYVVFKNYSDTCKVGDVIEFERVYIADVLNPNYSVQYYIQAPDNKYAVDINGKELNGNTDYRRNYKVFIDKSGTYLVNIFVEDSFGNQEIYSYSVFVPKESVVSYKLGKHYGSAKKGEKLKIAEVIGNDMENLNVRVFILEPSGIINKYTDGYTLKSRGEYTVMYYVSDSENNVWIKNYTISVGE